MANLIVHSRIDENGNARGGVAGDQNLREVCIQDFWDMVAHYVLRIANEAVRNQFVKNMIDIANNNNVGYDQGGRNTLLVQGIKVYFDFTNINVPCECDCSSMEVAALLGAIYTVLGKEAYEKAYDILVDDGNCATTRSLRSKMTKLFEVIGLKVTVFSTADYTRSTAKAEYGDIYLKENSHVFTYIGDGKPEDNQGKPDVIYQVYVDGKWLPWVTNYNTVNGNGYAGLYGKDISGIRVRLSNGETVTVQSHLLGKPNNDWLPAIKKCDNTNEGYAGIYGRAMDCLAIKAENHTLRYQVHTKNGKWLPWVDEYNINDMINGFAGNYGQAIDGVRIDVL